MIEVGFIDTSDLKKIQANIDKIGFLIAKYIAKICGIELSKPGEPSITEDVYYRVVCGSFKEKSNAEQRKKELETKGYSGIFVDIYKS